MRNTEPQKQETLGAFEVSVDLETGEVIHDEAITIKVLPRVARRIIANRESVSERTDTIDREIERLQAIRDIYTNQQRKVEVYLLDQCERLMKETGQEKLHYPGIGRLRWRKLPVSVNTDGYDAMNDDEKAKARVGYYGAFHIKTTVTPDKKAIMAILKSGDFPGFKLNEPAPKFEFKAEV